MTVQRLDMTFVDITPLQEELVEEFYQIQFQYKGSHLHILVEFPASFPSNEVKQRVEQALVRCQLPGIRHVLIYGRPIRATAIQWRLGFQVKLGPTTATTGRICIPTDLPPHRQEEVPTEIKILELPPAPLSLYSPLPSPESPALSQGKRRKRRRPAHMRVLRYLFGPASRELLFNLLIAGSLFGILTLAAWKGLELMQEQNEQFRNRTEQQPL